MGVFENSVSGLQAFQKALATTSHNISNVNTEGYSRQRVELGTRTPVGYGNGFVGSGVEVQTFKRIFDQTRETAVQRNTAEFERLQTLADNAGRIDDLVAHDTAGIAPSLQAFFGAVQDVASDPSSVPTREALISQGENLASRFRGMGAQFREMAETVNTQLDGYVAEANQLADSIARVNEKIATEHGRFGEPPNDLLDQRDALLRDLSAIVDTRTVENADGSLNVSVGTGQALVAGANHNELAFTPNPNGPGTFSIGLKSAGGGAAVDVTDQLSGGKVAGLIDFRQSILGPAPGADGPGGNPPTTVRGELDQLAHSFVTAFNGIHSGGNTLNGAAGGNFFVAPSGNPGSFTAEQVRVAIDEPKDVAAAKSGGGPGDNRNALAMADAFEQSNVNLGGATFQGYYARMVAEIGTKTGNAQVNRDAQETVLDQAKAARDEVSGVNLEEEAADLIQFQKAFQASAQAISIARSTFDSLLAATRG